MQDDEADMMLDSSHHHGDFLSPPGGQSPDARSAAQAPSTSETLAGAVDAVSHGATGGLTANGAQQGECPRLSTMQRWVSAQPTPKAPACAD
jgi:hypothetical protein